MLRLIAGMLLLLLCGQVALGVLAHRERMERAKLYAELRVYIAAANQYEGRARYWEGRYSQCAAYGY